MSTKIYKVTVEHQQAPLVEDFEVYAENIEDAKDAALQKAFEFFDDWQNDDEVVEVECLGEGDDDENG